MASRLSYVALVILLIGVATLVFGQVKLNEVTLVQVARSGDSVWHCTFNLTRGNTYRIDVSASKEWGRQYYAAGFTEAQPVNVTITSAANGVTKLQAFFYSIPPDSPFFDEGTPPAIISVKYLNVDDASIRVITPSTKIVIVPKQTGNYTVRLLDEGLWSRTPPNYFALIEEYTPNSDTYSLMSFGGGIVGIAGGVTYVVSVFRKGRMKPRKSRK